MSKQNGTQLLASSAGGLGVSIVALVVFGALVGFSTANDTNSLQALAFTQAAGPFMITAGLLAVARAIVMAAHAQLLVGETDATVLG